MIDRGQKKPPKIFFYKNAKYPLTIYTHGCIIKTTKRKGNTIMTIKTNSKKNYEATIKEYRAQGYNIITYTATITELEKGNELITITR